MQTDIKDQLLHRLGIITSLGMAALLLSLFLFIAIESFPVWKAIGIFNIIGGKEWRPFDEPAVIGILPMIVSTLWSALGAMFIAAPLGISCAVFLAEIAPPWLSTLIRTILNILTGIPSVVYGFLGANIIVPWYEKTFNIASGESLFCASLVLSVMVVPYIVAGSYGALKAIPVDYREAGYALGVSQVYITTKILMPLAGRNMVSAITLAFARAAGETMAVLMLAGNTLMMPLSWFSKGEPLSALIALELGSAEVGSPQYQGLFAAGLALLLFVAIINFSISYMHSRRQS